MDLLPLLLLGLFGVLIVWMLRRPAGEAAFRETNDAPVAGPVVESSGSAPDVDPQLSSAREPAPVGPAVPAFAAGLVTGAFASELLEAAATPSADHDESADEEEDLDEELFLFRHHGARNQSGEEERDDLEDQRELWEGLDPLEDDGEDGL